MFKGKAGTMTGVTTPGVKIFDVNDVGATIQGVKVFAAYSGTGTTTGVTMVFKTAAGATIKTLTSSSGVINNTDTIVLNKGGIEQVYLVDADTTAGLAYCISYEY